VTSLRRTIADESGFTLLEALIALAILSLATVSVGLAFPGLQQRIELRQAVARLDDLLFKARNEAQASGRSTVLKLDPDARLLSLDSPGLNYRLPRGVEFTIVGGAFGDDPAKPSIAFLSDGSSTGGVIELRSGELRAVRRVGWLTGRIDRGPAK
jgi:general secretion pathway protein H